MRSTVAPKPLSLTETQQLARATGKLTGRKLWLPKFLYDALPYFYILSGVGAFFATLYISDWFWVLPHYLLFSAACIHLGVVVHKRRHSRNDPAAATDSSEPADPS